MRINKCNFDSDISGKSNIITEKLFLTQTEEVSGESADAVYRKNVDPDPEFSKKLMDLSSFAASSYGMKGAFVGEEAFFDDCNLISHGMQLPQIEENIPVKNTGETKTNEILLPQTEEKVPIKNTGETNKDVDVPEEIGAKKARTQHVSNTGFALSSTMAAIGDCKNFLGITSRSGLAKYLPVLNVGVAALESYHTAKLLKKGEPVVAATCAGNAAGCVGAVLEEAALAATLTSTCAASMKYSGIALGIIGGVLGLTAGSVEIREGLKIKKAGGSSRTLAMGVLDMTSGVTSMTGGVLMISGIAYPVACACLMTAGICDVAGVGVDYFWNKFAKKQKILSPPENPS